MTAAVAAEVFTEAVHPLDAPVAALSTRNIDNWSGAAAGEEIVRLRRHIDQLEAESARLLRHFDDHKGDRDDGAPSLVSWLRYRCGLASGAAMQRVEVARQLPELPEAQERFRSGELGLSHAAVLARV